MVTWQLTRLFQVLGEKPFAFHFATNVALTIVRSNSNLGGDETQQRRLCWRKVSSMLKTVGKEALVACCKAYFVRGCSKQRKPLFRLYGISAEVRIGHLPKESQQRCRSVAPILCQLHYGCSQEAELQALSRLREPGVVGYCRRWRNLEGDEAVHYFGFLLPSDSLH